MDNEEEGKDDPFITSSGHTTFIGCYYMCILILVCLVGNTQYLGIGYKLGLLE